MTVRIKTIQTEGPALIDRMLNILMLVPSLPFPPHGGGYIRVLESIKALAKRNRITCLGLRTEPVDIPPMDNVTFEWVEQRFPAKWITLIKSNIWLIPYTTTKYHNHKLLRKIKDRLAKERFDILYAHFPSTCHYISHVDALPPVLVCDEHNNEILYMKSFTHSRRFGYRLLSKIEMFKVRHFLLKQFRKCTHHISCSQVDLNHTRTWAPPHLKLILAPNGVDLNFFDPNKISKTTTNNKPNILFCGSMHVTMNQAAVLNFIQEIFPIILRHIPYAQLVVCGKNPSKKILDMTSECVKVTGSVDDVRDFYASADVSIAPFQYGGGTKLKILESLAMHVPVVTTVKGCQGIDVKDGEQVLIAENPVEFANCVIQAIQNASLRNHLVKNGASFVQQYSWSRIYANVEKALRKDLAIFEAQPL